MPCYPMYPHPPACPSVPVHLNVACNPFTLLIGLYGSIDIEPFRQLCSGNVGQNDTNYRKVKMSSEIHHITVSGVTNHATYMAKTLVIFRAI
jgi:hypothetical protein